MAAFASCRRSGWVRLLVVILCALFIFTTLGAPPAQALGVEAVAVFGLASVLSAATAALGFKLASNEQGQATLQKMVQDFKTVAWATGFVLVGSKLNGLQHGMDYIKMQVQNGKTYLDSRVFAWVQQWLAKNGVYDSPSYDFSGVNSLSDVPVAGSSESPLDARLYYTSWRSFLSVAGFSDAYINAIPDGPSGSSVGFCFKDDFLFVVLADSFYVDLNSSGRKVLWVNTGATMYFYTGTYWSSSVVGAGSSEPFSKFTSSSTGLLVYPSDVTVVGDTGLSGTDTLGKDVVDLTLDQVLQKLKEWAQDWFDAGADSATNAATGAQDLPLTVATGAAIANPSIAEDGPLVWFPSFGLPIPKLRSGETDTKTVDQGKENASAAETSTVDVAENQSVIDSLVNWALNYISPDTGLFSKFPLCVPYDAYLLVTSSLGVDAVGSDSIFGASPGDLEGVVSQDIDTYSDFQPIINIKHDFELDGKTYPVELTIDLTPWQPFVTFFREGMALLLIAELIGSEFKRIRGH